MADSTGSAGQGGSRKQSPREIARLVVFALGLVLLIAFVIANSHEVNVGFVFFKTRISLIWVLLIAAVLGALVDRLVILLRQRRKKAAQTN
jgi:uncharacterized integral membrane protein